LPELYKGYDLYQEFLPDFNFLVINLHHYDESQINGIVYLQVALFIMKFFFSDELFNKLPDILSLLADEASLNKNQEWDITDEYTKLVKHPILNDSLQRIPQELIYSELQKTNDSITIDQNQTFSGDINRDDELINLAWAYVQGK
jgi:hypothetical protein